MQIYIFNRFGRTLFIVYIYHLISYILFKSSIIQARYSSCHILGFLWLFLHFNLQAQQPLRFDRIGRNEGLSQSSVNCMVRDRDGFMWFGSQDGLNQYDGRKFLVFQHQPGDSNSLSNNYVVSIAEDEQGYLWMGTMTGGLNRLDKRKGSFQAFRHQDSVNSISENTVWTVIADGEGNIWCGTSKGLNCYHKKNKRFDVFRPVKGDTNSLTTDMVVSLYKDSRGRIWIGTVEGLCMLDRSKNRFTRFYNPFEQELPGANLIWSITESLAGEIITGTNNGVYVLDPDRRKYARIAGSPKELPLVAWSVTAQYPGKVWVGSDRGLFQCQTEGQGIEAFLHNPVDPNSISDNNIWCLLKDPSGFLWAGTNNGISKSKSSSAHFNLITAGNQKPNVLSSAKIMAILEDHNGFLWLGTDGGGLNCLSPDRSVVKVYNSSNSALRNDNIWALSEDKEGNVFIGNYQGGVHRFDRKTGKISAYPIGQNGASELANPRVLCMLCASDGKVWIGTRGGGLSCLNPVTGQFTMYSNDKANLSGFPSNTVLSLAEDAIGGIWAGTHEGGLACLKPGGRQFLVLKHDADNVGSLSDNNVWSIRFDKKGRLWVGTQGGLNVCESPENQLEFRYFSTKDGLKSNTILGILDDSEGNLWLSSFNGISRLEMKTFEKMSEENLNDPSYLFTHPLFCSFDTDHGLQGLEFNQGAGFHGASGLLYFGGNNGLNYFSEKDVKASSFQPPVRITAMKIFNREVLIMQGDGNELADDAAVFKDKRNYYLPVSISYLRKIQLSYRESVISFEFAALDFSNPGKNQYAYKMINFDEDWNYVGPQNIATYTNLDPGEYTLLIRGTNSDGIWNQQETVLQIIITPPFWQKSWFVIIGIIGVLLLLFLIMHKVLNYQRKKAKREKELIELQLKSIKSQIDPHFAFNALNTIAGFIYSEQPDITYDYFTRFAHMVRNILEDNEQISRTLSEEIEFVKNYLELQKMRFKDKFDYEIVVHESISYQTPIPKMIIQSYAENAIKHGLMHKTSGGMLHIRIDKIDDQLLVVIEDNGIGREKAALLNTDTTKQGYRIMEQILDLYSKLYHTKISQSVIDLVDDAGNAGGTRVILKMTLPVSNMFEVNKKS